MPNYANVGDRSGVAWYDVGPDSIIVTFEDDTAYLYNATRPGRAAVDRMKVLAAAGRGLNGYINRAVRDRYARRLR